MIFLQVLAIVGLALLIDWDQVQQDSLVTTVAIAVVVGPFAMSVLTHLVQKKKEIGDLQEQTRFGQFDKHRLRKMFDDTVRRLNLPLHPIPVYVVADKYMNASMLHIGLGFFLRSLNGIYLHRQALHKLNAEEIQDIMGHELGHYYRYYLWLDRFRIVTLTLGALCSILIVQLIGLNHFGSMILLMLCTAALWKIVTIPQVRNAWTIEYLCDDLGAQVHGVEVSVAGLMKLGAEAEVLTAIQQQAAFSAHSGKLNAFEIVEAISTAIPYGHATREELQTAVEKSLKNRAAQGPTLGGFLRYTWQGDVDAETDEEFEAEMRKLEALKAVPRLPWESVLDRPDEIRFDQYSLQSLVQMIEQNPGHAIFLTPEAIGELDPLHPTLKQRILYLFYNRPEIELQRSSSR